MARASGARLARRHALKAGTPCPRLPCAILRVARWWAFWSSRRSCGGRRAHKRIAAAFDWQRRGGAGQFPGRRLGDAAGLHRQAAADPAGLASRRASCSRHRRGDGGRQLELVVRASGQSRLDVAARAALTEAKPSAKPPAPKGTEERHFTITAAGTATVRGARRDVSLDVQRHSGSPPTIALAKEPEPQARGSLLLTTSSRTTTAWSTRRRRSRSSGSRRRRRRQGAAPAVRPPDFPLVLPQARTRTGVGQTTKDLSEHPWAGAEVTMTLAARDEAGNEGRSGRTRCAAGAAVHQAAGARADRAAPQSRARCRRQAGVLSALDALTIAPERFIPESRVYLGLRSIYWQLAAPKSDDSCATWWRGCGTWRC